ncbi:chromosome segregation ATPase [Vibrio splendidus]
MCKRKLLLLTLFIYSFNVYSSQVVNIKNIGEQLEWITSNSTLVEDKTQSLLGVDLNGNKIRDDIDEVMSQLVMSDAGEEFITRYINYSFSILDYDFSENRVENIIFANSIYDEYRHVRHCYKESGVDGKDLYDTINIINKLIFNTDDRIVAYFNYEKYINIMSASDKVIYDC